MSALRDDARLEPLYASPMPATRAGALYNAFSYPTKIDPEAIALFVAAHTMPGDAVLDVFAGSGTTGLAVRLCATPTEAMRQSAARLGLPVVWGPRHAILYELSVVGSLLARVMCDPPDPAAFTAAANEMVAAANNRLGWMYETAEGTIRHAVWTDVVVCPTCRHQTTFWDLAAVRKPHLEIKSTAPCPHCETDIATSEAERATETTVDPLTSEPIEQRVRRLAAVYGRTGKATWQRPPTAADHDLLERIRHEPVPSSVPTTPIRWGDLRRSGYHQGIDRIHHFYTRRNLIALGTLWELAAAQHPHLADALRLLILSYNAAHSTLMTRVVVKKGMSDFVLTGAQSGVLYISSLPVEKNVFTGVARKVDVFAAAFAAAADSTSTVRVVNASSTHLDLPDRSVDYVFTDPPFGGFIPYAEINQLNEAWLGRLTDTTEEVIVSPGQGKGTAEYAALMKQVFAEVSRVMKDDAAATVVFHSSKADVWRALGDALASAGLTVRRASVLDKTQVSFKQVVTKDATRGNAVFLLSRDP